MFHSYFLSENCAQSTALFNRAAVRRKLAVSKETVVIPQCAGSCLCYRPVHVPCINLQHEDQKLLVVLFRYKNANTLGNRLQNGYAQFSVGNVWGSNSFS